MTSPQIGNDGVATDEAEINVPKVAGFIMREESRLRANAGVGYASRLPHPAQRRAIADIDTAS